MDKLIDAFVALPTAAQITLAIVSLIGTVVVTAATLDGVQKVVIAIVSCPKAVPAMTNFLIGVAIVTGLITTGHPGCVGGIAAMVIVVIVYEIAYYNRFDQMMSRGKDQTRLPH